MTGRERLTLPPEAQAPGAHLLIRDTDLDGTVRTYVDGRLVEEVPPS